MDISTLIEIVVVVAVVYFLLKFIVSPIIKIAIGVLSILIMIFLLQRIFGFNIDEVLAHFGISLNLNEWASSLNWILGPANDYIDQAKSLFNGLLQNVPKLNKP